MRKCIWLAFLLLSVAPLWAWQGPEKLSVEKIMRDPQWIGNSPSGPYWSADGKYLFFRWNPEKAISDSLYFITGDNPVPRKADYQLSHNSPAAYSVEYNLARTSYTFSRDGDIFLADVKTGIIKRITQTTDMESNPVFSFSGARIVYTRNQNLFSWDMVSGLTSQLTNFQKGAAPPQESRLSASRRNPVMAKEALSPEEKWLQHDRLELFDVLRYRKQKRELADSMNNLLPKAKEPRSIYLEDKIPGALSISPDGRFISYRLMKSAPDAKATLVPSYVTESGYTQDLPGRSKVGSPQGSYEFFVYDTQQDTLLEVKPQQIPGITDLPDYAKQNAGGDTGNRKKTIRSVVFNGPYWSPKGSHAVVDIRSMDNKDRWLMLLDAATGRLSLLDRQRDEAWIGGPGIGYNTGGASSGWIDEHTFWYQSEAEGYSHLYKTDVNTGLKTALTRGTFEVQQVQLSSDKKYFYLITNQANPGEQQFYRLAAGGGTPLRMTTMTGSNQVVLSPDEKKMAILYSYSNRPWELYVQDNREGSVAAQITFQAMSEEFRSYPWRDPQIVTFTAADGATVYARLYRPAVPHPAHPAVIFVHGAGYLQNVHKWWSSYFREYMFNNLLADQGYTVLDIDYRGSAGYGRDWRTGIYRHMGGKDLTDQVDGVKYLTEKMGVNPAHIGIYGGSYGGFITLMAMFTRPEVFAAGAGLRCVTDWANYNHGYTSNILNEPFNDSLAYKQSSPIYFAAGLRGHLLMCHGMLDLNVHFQDIVQLSQRLIELGKNNWELAVYPMEDHGFVEPSSWTDEYKRILHLFETTLK